MIQHLIAITIAIVIDLIIGDPPSWPHPVKWIGTLIAWLDKRLNLRPQSKKERHHDVNPCFVSCVCTRVVCVLGCLSDTSFGRHYSRKHSDGYKYCSQKLEGRGIGSI